MMLPLGRAAYRALGAVLAPFLMFGVFGLAACSDAPDERPDSGPPNPLLYEIAKADGAVEGWMIGTIHALPDDTRWRTATIDEVTGAADVLLVEVAALDDGAMLAATFAQAARAPGFAPIEQRIPQNLGTALAEITDRGDLNAQQLGTLDTWAAAITLAQVGADGDPANGVDRALIRQFAGRPVRELEGARAQFAIFDRLPELTQRRLLAAVIEAADEPGSTPEDLRRGWLSGDIAALEAANHSGILADHRLRETLLVQRNRDWTTQIVPMLAARPKPLIAVGAAHLVGDEGLVNLLQTAGYRLRRLP